MIFHSKSLWLKILVLVLQLSIIFTYSKWQYTSWRSSRHSKVISNWKGLEKFEGLSRTTTFWTWTFAMLAQGFSAHTPRSLTLKNCINQKLLYFWLVWLVEFLKFSPYIRTIKIVEKRVKYKYINLFQHILPALLKFQWPVFSKAFLKYLDDHYLAKMMFKFQNTVATVKDNELL